MTCEKIKQNSPLTLGQWYRKATKGEKLKLLKEASEKAGKKQKELLDKTGSSYNEK